jgi:TRAP-type C4-dicarboxylate transport system permease small subunit
MGRILALGSGLVRVFAAICLVAMMLTTVADIVGRHVFSAPIPGTVDLVELALVYLVFLGIALVFLAREHIVVDVLEAAIPRWLVGWLDRAALWLSTLLLLTLCYAMWIPFQDTWVFGDRTMDLRIPLVWHWLAIWLGIGLSTLILAGRLLRLHAPLWLPPMRNDP